MFCRSRNVHRNETRFIPYYMKLILHLPADADTCANLDGCVPSIEPGANLDSVAGCLGNGSGQTSEPPFLQPNSDREYGVRDAGDSEVPSECHELGIPRGSTETDGEVITSVSQVEVRAEQAERTTQSAVNGHVRRSPPVDEGADLELHRVYT